MSTRTTLRALAVLVPLLMLAAALPAPGTAQAGQPIAVFYERPDQTLAEISANPVGWAEAYPLGFPIGAGQTGALELTVRNDGASTINKLSFQVPRDKGQVRAPTEGHEDDDSYIEFQQGTSRATGWVATVTDSPSDNQITFTYDTGGVATQLTPGKMWKFTIGYTVRGPLQTSANDVYQFPVRVQGVYTTTDLTAPYTFRFTVDDDKPEVVDQANARSVLTRDLDGNGRLDQVIVNYDDLLDVSTFVLEHFRIGSRPVQADFDWIAPGADLVAGEPQHGDCPPVDESPWGCTQVLFMIEEASEPNTGTHLFVSYNPQGDSLADFAANRVPAVGKSAADGAAPVLMGALARTVDSTHESLETVLLTFSEGITAATALEKTDFYYQDTSDSAGRQQTPDGNGGYLDYPALLKVEHLAGQDYVVLVFRDGQGGGTVDALTKNDAPAVAPETAKDKGSADLVGCRVAGGLVRIKDLSTSGPNDEGIPCRTAGANVVPILSATVVEAATDIGTQEVRLRFNAPVEAANGGDITSSQGVFDIAGAQSGGVIAIVKVTHERCTDTVVLEVKDKVFPTDVDDTPAKIIVEPGKIKGCSKTYSGGTGANMPTLSPAPIALKDTTPPKVMKLSTVDMDHNGAIDGFEVTFSEPVRDISFCAGSNPCPIGGFIRLHVRDPAEANVYKLEDYGPFTFETRSVTEILGGNTAVGKDDNIGLIRWPQNDPNLPGALLTGYVPDLEIEVGLIEDLAPTKQVGGANLLKKLTRPEVEETDGAAPVLMAARTLDTDTHRINATGHKVDHGCVFNAANVNQVGACQRAPNGFLDGYMLTFSEPVRDSSYTAAEWMVDGYQLESLKPARTSRDAADGRDDRFLFLPFFEKNRTADNKPIYGDTGALPELTYRALPASRGGLKDLRGNGMDPVKDSSRLDIAPGDIEETDGAAPVIVAAEGFIGQSWVRVHFSEGVDDGQDGALVRSDFVWKNIHLGGAGGITNSPQVEHRPGDREAVVWLNNKLALGDIMEDQISAYYDQPNGIGAIYETQTKVISRQFVSGAATSLQNATDRTPPGNVTELNATLLHPDRVVLMWRAPSEDGNLTGPDAPAVNHYSIKVSTEHISSFKGGTNVAAPPEGDARHSSVHDLPDGATIEAYDPVKFARPGNLQAVEIVGLRPDTKYNFAVIAVDEEGLVSPEAAIITRSTAIDTTPPTGTMAPRVTNKLDGRVVTLEVDVAWDALTDEETKPVQYRFLLSRDPNAEVTRDQQNKTDQTQVTVKAPSRGTWYFHIRGFSGVPGEQAAPLEIEITAPPIDTRDAEDYVFFFNNPTSSDHSVNVKRDGSANVVKWTLPEGPPGTVEAVQIWRLDGFDTFLVATIPGDFQALRAGEYRDTNGTAKSGYFVTPVYEGSQGMVDPGELGLLEDQWTYPSKSSRLATYWYVVIGLGILLLAGAVVLFVVLRGRADVVPAPDPDHTEGWSDVSEEGALPTHDVDCPQCNNSFQAVGHLPLPIQCPECGVAGKLE